MEQLIDWFVASEGEVQKESVPGKKKGHLRLCTYNVHFWLGPCQVKCMPNENAIIAVIAAADADILVLNECFPISDPKRFKEMVKRLEQELGYVHHTVEGSPKYTDVTFVTVIFSRQPFEETSEQMNLWGERHAVRVCVPGGLNVVGLHCDLYDESGATRVKQVAQILAKTARHANVVLAGDMNALRRADYSETEWHKLETHDALRKVKLDTSAVDLLEKDGFSDSFKGLGEPPSCTTWSGRRIDYVFLKAPQWKVSQSFVIHSAASDHTPVVADLVRKSE